jgi:hypothetical protein
MQEFLITSLLGLLLIAVCSLTIYEVLRLTWSRLPRLSMPPRLRVLLVIVVVFCAHIFNIWVFGAVYYALTQVGMGTLAGASVARGDYVVDFFGCLYFSAVSYSTLGLGDVTPEGALRMIAGVEALSGFILIGWTVSFTYLTMEKFWELPHRRGK